MSFAALRLRAKSRSPLVVGDGCQARKPALAECGRCGECGLASAPAPGEGALQLMVIRETSPVRGGVGQPQTTGWSRKGPTPGLSRSPLAVPREFDVVCRSQRVALASSPFCWTLDPTLDSFLLFLFFILCCLQSQARLQPFVMFSLFPCTLVTHVFSEVQTLS